MNGDMNPSLFLPIWMRCTFYPLAMSLVYFAARDHNLFLALAANAVVGLAEYTITQLPRPTDAEIHHQTTTKAAPPQRSCGVIGEKAQPQVTETTGTYKLVPPS